MTAPDLLRQRHNGKPADVTPADADTHTHTTSKQHEGKATDAQHDGVPAPPPTEGDLPFTLKDIRDAIPPHCFERSAIKSGLYLLRDVAMWVGLALTVAAVREVQGLPTWVYGATWLVYWWLSGWVATGVWVIAHECGHQAFSASKTINDTVGWFVHSALLVPYHAWRITHGQHHAATNSMEDDSVFVPSTRSESTAAPQPAHHTLFQLTGSVIFGFPIYLLTNQTGPAKHRGKRNDHFTPSASMFKDSQYWEIIVSDIGVAIALAVLAACVYNLGFLPVFMYYGIPYFCTVSYLVIITYLQHTDVYVPHFREGKYSWLRGALCTVDRRFGFGMDWFLHHITDSHVAHHIFHTMPFYHAVEATQAIRRVAGKYYLRDNTPWPVALWRSWTHCQYVDDSGDVLWYKKATH